jgi:radical SAM enzyme (TIGR01210 family)
MVKNFPLKLDDKWIRSQRSEKNKVDPNKPYAYLIEKERTSTGSIEDVGTIFLTNKECPYTCLMCDLWKNTTDFQVPAGAIPEQMELALSHMPDVKHIKLYNSGNFFDVQAIPPEDYMAIASRLRGFSTVLVESHPKLVTEKCLRFRDMLKPDLQIALGLETVHPEILPLLNKRMALKDFERSVQFLNNNEIRSRAFILLRTPFMSEEEGIEWAKKSIDFAFQSGVECCVIIPTRSGNGAIDWLEEKNQFTPPDIKSLEKVVDYGISLNSGRVFADLWDIELFSSCDTCFSDRKKKLEKSNLQQQILPTISCTCN